MDGAISTTGGSSSLDMFSFQLAPPGKEGENYGNLATDIHGNVIGNKAPIGGSQASKDYAGHFGYSDKDTMGTKLDDVFQIGQQLNVAILINGSPDAAIQLYLNTVDPTLPALAPIKTMLVISERQLEKGSLAGYQLFVADENLQAASKKHDKHQSQPVKGTENNTANSGAAPAGQGSDSNSGGAPQGGNTGNDSAAFEAASLGVNPGQSYVHSGDHQIARNRTIGAAGAAATSEVDATDVHGKAHTGSTAAAPAGTGTNDADPKTNTTYMFNTKDGNTGSGDDNSGGNNSGNNSRNQSGDTIDGDATTHGLAGAINAHAKAGKDYDASLSGAVDQLGAADAAQISTITLQKTSNGNPWLAGSPFVEFQIAFNQLQRILMQNTIVQGRVELASMKMTVDLAHQAADAIMAIARMNQMIHIMAAVMAAVSMAMTIGCLGMGLRAASKSGVNAEGGSVAGKSLGLDSEKWTAVGQTGQGMNQMATAIVQAMTDIPIAQKEGLKEMLQAYRTIVQHIMDKVDSAIKSNEDMITQLLQMKDKIADSTQQAVAAALSK